MLGLLLVCSALAACRSRPASDKAQPTNKSGAWRAIAAPPSPIPLGHEHYWVGNELIFIGHWGVASLAYRPADDRWRVVAAPPATDEPAGWTMVAAGDRLVALARTATKVYNPNKDNWQSLPAPPAPRRFIDPEKWAPSLAWTGKEVALAQPYGDDFAALDLARGAWRRLPSTGTGEEGSHRLLATSAGLVDVGSPVHLLAPGAKRWRALPPLPPQTNELTSAGDFIFGGGLLPGTNTHVRGRYTLPSGQWQPLPPSPVWAGGRATALDGGIVTLWYGTATERSERPNGVLLRPGEEAWEVVPPPPAPVWGGELLAAGRDALLIEDTSGPTPARRLVARFEPPQRLPAWTEPPTTETNPCRAASVTASHVGNELTRSQRYTVFLANQGTEPCTLTGPVELTATDERGAPILFPNGRSNVAGPTFTAVPGFRWGGKVTIEMRSGFGTGPPMTAPECAGAPSAAHLFLTWPGAGGSVEAVGPTASRPLLCNVDVSPFLDPWPSW